MGTIPQQSRPNGRRPVPLSHHGREHADAYCQGHAKKSQGPKIMKNERDTLAPSLAGEKSDDDDVATGQQRAFRCIHHTAPQPDAAFHPIELERHAMMIHRIRIIIKDGAQIEA